MKSRINHSGPPGHRLLIVNSVILLLVNCFILVQSEDQNVKLSSWIEVSDQHWPPTDPNDKKEFLVYHSEYDSGKLLFGLKKTFYKDLDLINNPDLSFRYWATGDGSLRSRKDSVVNRDYKLTASNSWAPTKGAISSVQGQVKANLKEIDKDEWSNFAFISQNVFTLAMKDVSVKYMERVATDKYTAYPTDAAALEHFVEENPAVDGEKTLTFKGKSASFNLVGVKKISLKLKVGDEKEQTVAYPVDTADKVAEKKLKKIFQGSEVDTTAGTIKVLRINVEKDGFVISSISDDTPTPSKPIKPQDLKNTHLPAFSKDPKTDSTRVFTITKVTNDQVKGYIQYVEPLPVDKEKKDVFYTVQLFDTDNKAKVDVYLTLKDAKIGFKLDTVTGDKQKKIVPLDYLALQNIGNFMITFVVHGDVNENFKLSVKSEYQTTPARKASSLAAPVGPVVSNAWLYYNQNFDYSFTSEETAVDFALCDIVANCYPYEKDAAVAKKFTLSDKFLKELSTSKSPFVRVQSSKATALTPTAFVNADDTKLAIATKEKLTKKFFQENEKSVTEKTPAADLKYTVQFDKDNRQTKIIIPLDSVDLRVQELTTTVAVEPKPAANAKSPLSLTKLEYKKTEGGEVVAEFPLTLFDNEKLETASVSFKTDQLFAPEPTQLLDGHYIELTLELEKSSNDKVLVNFDVARSKRQIIDSTDATKAAKFSADVDTDVAKHLKIVEYGFAAEHTTDSKKQVIKIDPKRTILIGSDWIQSVSKDVKTKLEFKIKAPVANQKITDANIGVYRVVIENGNVFQYKDKIPPTTDATGITTFTDAWTDTDKANKGYFRVGYVIHSKETFAITTTIQQFEIQATQTPATDNNCMLGTAIAYTNCQYETLACPSSNFDPPEGNVCQLKKLNRLTDVQCEMNNGCENIFDRKLPTSKLDTSEPKYVPFQIETTEEAAKDSKLFNLKYERPEASKTGDFCLTFSYIAEESNLAVSLSPDAKGEAFKFPLTVKNVDDTEGKICASWLDTNVDNVRALYFTFAQKPLLNIDRHYIYSITPPDKADENPVVNSEGIYFNQLTKNSKTEKTQFSSLDQEWGFDTSSLTLSLTKEKLIDIPNNPNAVIANNPAYISKLRTKWVKVPNKDGHLRIAFDYDGKTSNTDKIVSELILSVIQSPYQVVWTADVSTIKSDKVFEVDKTVADGYYYLEIEARFNLSGIEKLNTLNTLKDIKLSFNKFTINDPCVSDKNEFETCSYDKAATAEKTRNHGHCERRYGNFTHKCVCENNFSGDLCETFDFCKDDENKGWKVCKTKKCVPDPIFNQIRCECAENEAWDPLAKECKNTKNIIVSCPDNEILNKDLNKCDCKRDGFVKLATGKCVVYEQCNVEHRKLSGLTKAPCNDQTAKCTPIANKGWNAFECVCEKGINQNGDRTPQAKCLPEDECSKCENSCVYDGTTKKYICEKNKCEAPFKYDTVKNDCVLDTKSSAFIGQFNCPGGADAELELKADKKPGCKCGDRLFDEQTRGCSTTECSPEVTKECTTNRNAEKCVVSNFKAQCECKKGSVPYSTNATDENAWGCIPNCDVLALPKHQSEKCSASFEQCNPEMTLTPGSNTKDAKLIAKVLLPDTTLAELKDSCKCLTGFQRNGIGNNGRCEPTTDPTHVIKGMEFDLKPTSDENAFLERAGRAFKKLIDQILAPKTIKQIDPKCVKVSATTISCSTSFESDVKDADIKKKLDDACVKVGDKCVYNAKPVKTTSRRRRQAIGGGAPQPDDSENVLSRTPTTQKPGSVEVVNYCETPNICAKYQFSSCRNNDKNQFECRCDWSAKDLSLFKVVDTDYVKTVLQMQTCEVRDFCTEQKAAYGCAADATCHAHVERDGSKSNEYLAVSYCTCPKSNLTLANHELTCKKTCDAKCGNSADCAIDYLTSKVTCHCKEGYSGDDCSKKVESETTSKAYLISTIVVSIIAVIALIGLAVLYFRRR